MVINAENRKVLGIHMIAPEAADIINQGIYSKSRKPRIYPWMNAFSAEGGQLNSFCCEAVLEDTTALAVELHILKGEMTIDDVIDSLPVFPTLSEAIKIAALSFTADITKLSCCI